MYDVGDVSVRYWYLRYVRRLTRSVKGSVRATHRHQRRVLLCGASDVY